MCDWNDESKCEVQMLIKYLESVSLSLEKKGKSLQVCWSLPKWEKPQQSSRMNKISNWYISKDKKQDITTEPQFKLHKLEQVAKQLHNKNKNQH